MAPFPPVSSWGGKPLNLDGTYMMLRLRVFSFLFWRSSSSLFLLFKWWLLRDCLFILPRFPVSFASRVLFSLYIHISSVKPFHDIAS